MKNVEVRKVVTYERNDRPWEYKVVLSNKVVIYQSKTMDGLVDRETEYPFDKLPKCVREFICTHRQTTRWSEWHREGDLDVEIAERIYG